MSSLENHELHEKSNLVRRSWKKRASSYDKSIGFFERRVFGEEHRQWACSQTSGDVLEVAVGTGLNLAHYPDGVRLTGIDLTPEMIELARDRARKLNRDVELREANAHDLPFEDSSFDSIVCTYSLCNIPDENLALSEMARVLRPGGKLILVDHIRSRSKPVLWFQKGLEFFSRRREGEHMTRRPAEHIGTEIFDILERDRHGMTGIVERVVAVKKD